MIRIDADANCAIGGEALVQETALRDSGRRQWMHVLLKPTRWEAGYLMVVEVLGSNVAVSGVVCPCPTLGITPRPHAAPLHSLLALASCLAEPESDTPYGRGPNRCERPGAPGLFASAAWSAGGAIQLVQLQH